MKTPGFIVVNGYLAPESLEVARSYAEVPAPFWARLKHAIAAHHRLDEFTAEAVPARAGGPDAERLLFSRWVQLLGLDIPDGHYFGERLWPWSRGWTEREIDQYLALRVVAPTETPRATP